MGLPAPNKIKEKIVYRMRNPSTKARTRNDEKDPLHALHLQEDHIGPPMSSDIFSLPLSLTLSLSLFLSRFPPQPLNFFLREIGFKM